jgi:hypothetical protein
MEQIKKESEKIDFDNLTFIAKNFIDKLNEASKLNGIISRFEVLNEVYIQYQELYKGQSDIATKHLQFAFLYHIMADSLESKSKIESIKQQIKKL